MIELVHPTQLEWALSMPTRDSNPKAWSMQVGSGYVLLWSGRARSNDQGSFYIIGKAEVWKTDMPRPSAATLADELILEKMSKRFRKLFGWPPVKRPARNIREFSL